MPLFVTSGAQWDDRRNTSMVHRPDPENSRQLTRMLAAARVRGEDWIRWIDDGCPELSIEEYERVSTFKKRNRG